jgi:predicted metallopeptidase
MRLQYAPDVQEKASEIIRTLELEHIDSTRIIYMRSNGSKANAYARIWELPRIWQMALDVRPHYVIEVLSEKFDPLNDEEKEQTIIHELLHIPQKFSGALVPHYCFGKTRVGKKVVSELHEKYKKKKRGNY